jgi:hypothetical protein
LVPLIKEADLAKAIETGTPVHRRRTDNVSTTSSQARDFTVAAIYWPLLALASGPDRLTVLLGSEVECLLLAGSE